MIYLFTKKRREFLTSFLDIFCVSLGVGVILLLFFLGGGSDLKQIKGRLCSWVAPNCGIKMKAAPKNWGSRKT